MARSGRAGVITLYLIFFCSGIAGLGYEIVWVRMFAVGLGHEMPGVLAVVAAFFGGLALGAWALDGRLAAGRAPGRWYAVFEAVIGVWALVSIALIPAANRLAAVLMGVEPGAVRHWLVGFTVPLIMLLPATAAMGATLPAMDRLCSRLRGVGRNVGGLYAVNTAGAVAGVLAATFALMPALGYARTLAVLAAVNALCVAGTLLGPARGERERPPVTADMPGRPGAAVLGLIVLATGLLGIGYEVLGVRVMGEALENTVYTFAAALAVYLVGIAAGGAAYQRFGRNASFGVPLGWLLQGLAVTCLLGTLVLSRADGVYEWARATLGGGAAASIGAEMFLAAAVFGIPAALMGAAFSHLAQAARGSGGGVGRALALNTVGAAVAPILFGVLMLPALGAKWSLAAVAFGYLLLLLPVPQIKARHMIPSLAAVPVFALLPPRIVLIDVPEGTSMIEYREGVMASVAVIEDALGDRVLKVNDRFQMGGTARSFADRRQALIPILLHPGPVRVLFLGLGTGITAGAAAAEQGLEITGVELVPEVVEVLPAFGTANRLDDLDTIVVADARRFVRATDETYDVVVADLFHPARDGAGALYTREHFRAVRGLLNEAGVFCQWLPLHQLDLDTVRLITRTFLDVFPDATAWIAHFNVDTPLLGLIGGAGGALFAPDWYERRVTDMNLVAAAYDAAIVSGPTLFGCLLAANDDLRRFAGSGPLNTDDHPRVVFEAPSLAYRDDQPAHERLAALLEAFDPSAEQILHVRGDPAMAERVDAYLAARDLYLRALILLEQGRDEQGVGLLVRAVRASLEFRTAYTTALQIAVERKESDPDRAHYLLESLIEANPHDHRGQRFMNQLFPE